MKRSIPSSNGTAKENLASYTAQLTSGIDKESPSDTLSASARTSSTSRSPQEQQRSASEWFGQHPIISTVLWMIGSSMAPNDVRTSVSGKLKWKDENGSDLTEFIRTVQVNSPKIHEQDEALQAACEHRRTAQPIDAESIRSPGYDQYVPISPISPSQ